MYCVILELEGNPLQYPGSISIIFSFWILDVETRLRFRLQNDNFFAY